MQPASECPRCHQHAVTRATVRGGKGKPSYEVEVCTSCGLGGQDLKDNAARTAAARAAETRRRRQPTAADRARARRNRSANEP